MLKFLKKKSFWRILGILFLLFLAYLVYLHHVIVSRFESRRWNLPSRVYADSYPLYNGQTVTTAEMNNRLLYLGYRKKNAEPKFPGQYQLSRTQYKIYLHDFDYPHEKFKGFPIAFQINGSRIYDLKNLTTGESLSLSKLEPELITSIFDEKMEDRTFVALDKIPDTLIQSVILIEDERFYSHYGIDPIGIARAFLTNFIKGRLVQGGSTLTQQMVKNFFLTHERTLVRKINEMLMAMIIELRYSKKEILEVYLNEIYFGQRGNASVTGVQEASRLYFSKNVSQLTPDESALIAAMIKAPGLYSPFRKPKKATSRRNLILKRLSDHKVISKQEYEQANSRPLPTRTKQMNKTRATYFVDFLKKQIKKGYPQDILSSEGLRIFTTLDMYLQRKAKKAVVDWLNHLENQRAFLKKNTKKNKFLEGALIAIQPKTGFIRAYVGGRDYAKNQFDIISSAKRQPGSTFKPFVYLTAMNPQENKDPFTLSSILDDNPLTIKSSSGKYRPNNYDKKFHGNVSLRKALEMSYNVATVWLSMQVGLDKIVKTATSAGMSKNLKPYPSLGLGAFEVTPLEMTTAYTVFPNNGIQSKPLAIRRIVTPEGKILEKKSFEMKKIFPHDVIFLMNKALEGVMNNGTGRSARARGFSKTAAGKTGTTSEYKDSWFVGYTPDLLSLVWVGYKDNSTTNLSGASGALPIWTKFMIAATNGKPNYDFKPTKNIVIVPIDKATGLLYRRRCGQASEEYFIEGTEPTDYCR